MKTLTHELYAQDGVPVAGKLSIAYSWDVLMQDGGVYSSTPKTHYSADGVFSVPILAADDPGIEPGYEGFTTRVSWSAIAPDCNGRMAEGKVTTKTLQVVLADPEPVSIADLDNVTPATMGGVWYGQDVSPAVIAAAVEAYLAANPIGAEGIQDVVGAMIVAAGGTYDDEAGTITLPSSGGGDTTVQIGTVTLPESPTEGLSVSVLADSDTVLPEGVTWDSGGAPTITERMLLVFVWSGADWVGTYGLSIPDIPATTTTTTTAATTTTTTTAATTTTTTTAATTTTTTTAATTTTTTTSGWTPADLGASLYAWFDASDEATITDVGGVVSQWDDKSGNARHVSQSNETLRPVTGAVTINGRNAIRFVTNKGLTVPLSPLLQIPITLCIVSRMTSTATFRYGLTVGQHQMGYGSTNQWRLAAGQLLSLNGSNVNDPHVLVGVSNGPSSSLSVDGGTPVTGDAGTPAHANHITIGTPTYSWEGDVGELVIYAGAMSPADQAALVSYFRAKWATP